MNLRHSNLTMKKKIAKIKRICILYKFNLYLLKFIPIEIKMILTGFVYMY